MTLAAYAPHDAFVLPARRSPQLGRLVMGILAVEFLFAIALTLLGTGLNRISPSFAESFFYGDTPLGLLTQLCSFALLGVCVNLILVKQHDWRLLTAIGPLEPAFRNMIACLLAVALLFLSVEILPPWHDIDAGTTRRNLILWAMTVPFAMIALLIQTGAEELFYRGYIQQQLAARFPRAIVWMTVPNLLFAASHWDNGSTQAESLQYVIWAFFFGLAASDLTARTGNLGAAIGFHLANNAYVFLLFGQRFGSESGLALFLFPPEVALPGNTPVGDPVLSLSLMVELGFILASWLAARIAVRR